MKKNKNKEKKVRKRRLSIKWKIFLYFLLFATIMLSLLWIFQTVYLEQFYKYIKLHEFASAQKYIEETIEEDDFDTDVENIAENYDICILVTDSEGNYVYSSDHAANCAIHKLPTQELKRLIKKVDKEGNLEIKNNVGLSFGNTKPQINMGVRPQKNELKQDEQSEDIQSDIPENDNSTDGEDDIRKETKDKSDRYQSFMNMPHIDETESIIKVEKYLLDDGTEYFIFINSIITPVGATVYTLRIQLIIVSAIMVVIALVIAVVISTRISRPIISIKNNAIKMAKGNYEVKFEDGSYKEINELSDTLNYTANELKKTESLQHEIIANVSHDLRTPLTMITAYSEVMRDIPGENSPENVQVIIDEANRLTNLVNDMLDISKLQAGVTSFDAKEYNITAGIKSVVDRYSRLVEQDGYKVTFIYKEEDIMVMADEFKIYQVLYNLMNNAINYTGEDKSVTISQIVSGHIVRIEVTDTGEGIAADEINNVWERYYKIDKKHKRAVMGSGLGLSIVKNILKLHNAKYGVNSKIGEGTTFWFELKTL